ncbi:hypothetical protein GY45DRAFT_482058 [Cubamyces sp. BRFM 1775]|nr:hypothetical protein GY45DRAFT_482058 [Cubamyces sp. BRFM 1775]
MTTERYYCDQTRKLWPRASLGGKRGVERACRCMPRAEKRGWHSDSSVNMEGGTRIPREALGEPFVSKTNGSGWAGTSERGARQRRRLGAAGDTGEARGRCFVSSVGGCCPRAWAGEQREGRWRISSLSQSSVSSLSLSDSYRARFRSRPSDLRTTNVPSAPAYIYSLFLRLPPLPPFNPFPLALIALHPLPLASLRPSS